MAHYSLERRESVVRRMLNEGISMSVLARETGIAEGTLYRWRDAVKPNEESVNRTRKHEKTSPAQKFAIVVETASFNEAELAEHCRTKGLYPDQVKAWRQTWALASLGVYLRDVSQFIGVVTTAMMFLSPIFYPASALPEEYRHLLLFNPLTPVIEQAREVSYWGKVPDMTILSVYLVGATFIAWLGFAWFQKTRKGFADVL